MSSQPYSSSSSSTVVTNSGKMTLNDSVTDIVKLLVHYPVSAFSLNPWKVWSLFSQVESSIAKHSRQSTVVDDNRVLTKLLKVFGQQFDVSLSDLSNFFAS